MTYDALLDLLQSRRSVYAFRDAPVADDDVRQILEAARFAPSSYNEQPWRLVLTRRGDDGYRALVDALTGANPEWAQTAPVLGLALATPTFARNGARNLHAWHDVGAFMAVLSLAAAALGLGVHQIAGIDREAAADALGVPDEVDVVVAFALGHPTETPGAGLPPALAVRDRADKGRRPIEETAYGPLWGRPLP